MLQKNIKRILLNYGIFSFILKLNFIIKKKRITQIFVTTLAFGIAMIALH